MLKTKELTVGYDNKAIVKDVNIEFEEGKFHIIIGCNGSGKSTFLKSVARLLTPMKGEVLLNNKNIASIPSKEVAKKLAILPQSPYSPDDLTVFNLVKQGRYPYQSFFKQWSTEDERAVMSALKETGIEDLAHKQISTLSGGQRQRVWISMVLAQETEILLFDEPTNHLDIKYRIEVLDLLKELNKKENRTILVVLHDINLACRYADHIIALKEGRYYKEGSPEEIIDEKLIKDIFNIDSKVVPCPVFASPMVVAYQK